MSNEQRMMLPKAIASFPDMYVQLFVLGTCPCCSFQQPLQKSRLQPVPELSGSRIKGSPTARYAPRGLGGHRRSAHECLRLYMMGQLAKEFHAGENW